MIKGELGTRVDTLEKKKKKKTPKHNNWYLAKRKTF